MLRPRYAPQWAFDDTMAQKSHCAYFYYFGTSKCLWWGDDGGGDGGNEGRYTITTADLNLLTVI